MKKIYLFLFLLMFISLGVQTKLNAQSSIYAHSLEIQTLVDAVKIDTMWAKLAYISTQERYTKNSNSANTATYLKAYMQTMGFDTVYFQTYTFGSGYTSPNIIGIKYGETIPDSVFIACGHWDAYASMAPGADDNGSGTVSVLEAARILSSHNFKKTLKFCLFSGEEEGLYGSEHYVSVSTGEKIGAALNLDMVSYQDPGINLRIGVLPKSGTIALYNKVSALQQLYVSGIEIGHELGCPYSCTDIYPFWDAGYDGLFFFESSYFGEHETPYYHTSNDLINTSANSQPKLEKTTKIVVASLATWAESYPVSVIENYSSIKSLSNYPNPFNTATKISFQLNANSSITLKVTDITGKVVATLIDNEYKYTGIYEVPFDASSLEGGMYLYNLTTENGSVTQKMMLIK
jgi:aminopeptidase YwaD